MPTPLLLPLTLSFAILLLPARGETASSGLIVTFENIPTRIRHDNPDLAAARLRIKEALGNLHQAGRRHNPELDGGFESNHDLREGRLEIGISQRFPVTNRLLLEKNISRVGVQAAEAEVREVERLLVAEARAALVDVLAHRQQRSLRQEQVAVANNLAEFIRNSATAGELSPIDAGQARLEAARLASEIRQLQASEVAAIGRIKPLLGMTTTEVLHVSGSLPAASFPAGAVDPDRRPDFQAAKLGAQAASEAINLERTRRYEDVEAGIVASLERSEDAPEGFQNKGIVGFRVKLALPFWDKNEGNIQAAEARAERKHLEVTALAHNIRHQAGAAQAEMVEWSKLLSEISSNLLPLAATQATEAEQAYRDGLGDLQAVLRASEQLLQLKASHIEASRSFHQARVRFEAAAATP